MKIVLVGCGSIAAVHAMAISQMENHRLVAFADNKPEKAAAFAGHFGGRAYPSLESMLEQEEADVLHICTPHYLHAPMVICALKRGLHVFCEKPPVIDLQQWEEVRRVAAVAGGRLGYCFQNRYNHSVARAKELIADASLGAVKGARAVVTWNRTAQYYTGSDWRGSLATEGGGALINQSIHSMDLLGQLMGRPYEVDAVSANHHLKGIIEVEDMMEAYIRYERGSASFYATTAYCDDRPPLIEVACEKATIRIEDQDLTLLYPDGTLEAVSLRREEALGKRYWGTGHKSCIADFYDCCETGERFSQDPDGVEEIVRLMLATYESAATHRPVSLAW